MRDVIAQYIAYAFIACLVLESILFPIAVLKFMERESGYDLLGKRWEDEA